MAYVKQTWTDRVTEHPIRRRLTQISGDVYDISREQGEVQQEGTPITAERLNHMENGIAGAAVPDGTYPDMSVGSAEQLGASRDETVTEEFLFRPTAGTIDIRDNITDNAEIKAIYGKTVVWNQLVQNGNFENSDGWSTDPHSTLTVSENVAKITVGSASESYFYTQLTFPNTLISIENHKYFISVDVRSSVDTLVRGYFGGVRTFYQSSVLSNGIWHHVESIIQAVVSHNGGYICGSYRPNQGDTMEFRKFNIIDLTLMFGAGNEPATVEEFRSMFPLPYYAYDAGSLLSFSATGLKTVGFNQWDEEYRIGYYDGGAGGVFRNNGTINRVCNVTPIRVIPGSRLYFKNVTFLYGHDGDGLYVQELTSLIYNGRIESIPSWCHYVNFSASNAYGAVYNHDICINLSHSGYRDGEYKPYVSETLPLPISTYFPTGMKSAGTVRDELRKDMAIQRIGAVDLGTLDWTSVNSLTPDKHYYRAIIPSTKNMKQGIEAKLLVAIPFTYLQRTGVGATNMIDMAYINYDCFGLKENTLVFYKEQYAATPLSEFKSAISGVTLYYELAAPNNTPINPPLDFVYRAEDFGTEKVLLPEGTEPTSTPMYADISYVQNLRDKLDHLPFNPSEPGDYIVHFDGSRQMYAEIGIITPDDLINYLKEET